MADDLIRKERSMAQALDAGGGRRRIAVTARARGAARPAKPTHHLSKFEALGAKRLSPLSALHRDIAISRTRGSLLELEAIRTWERDPDRYSTLVSTSIFLLMNGRLAPEERLRAVVARERMIPKLLGTARANLENPPHVFTEVAVENIGSIEEFFANDVPAAFSEVRDKRLREKFAKTNAAVIQAVQTYEGFLEELLPRSNGDFRLGSEHFASKLLHEEMVDIPLDGLLAIGWEDLRRNQSRFKETAVQIDPNQNPQAILSELERQHPGSEQLLQIFRDSLDTLRDFVVMHGIVTLPSMKPPRVEKTPPFAQALTFASLESPGPYERISEPAVFYVTLPDPSKTPEQIEEYMAAFNRGTRQLRHPRGVSRPLRAGLVAGLRRVEAGARRGFVRPDERRGLGALL